MSINEDEKFIKLSIEEAKKGGVFVHPNPKVGAVIVKDGKILSKGYHKEFGKSHAEVNAIKKLSPQQLKNSTIYVSLEPCSTYGKTPPCTDLIIKSKIKKVVFSTLDPNPLNTGKSIELFKKNNIEVEYGILEEESIELNKPFFKNMQENLPYITLKLGTSIDSKIANKSYNAKWITSEKSRQYSHYFRAESDCILVGVNTIIKDDPLLNIRYCNYRKNPDICIIDRELKTPLNSRIFKIKERKIYIISEVKSNKYPFNVEIINMKFKKELNLKKLIKTLYNRGIRHILVEGGGKTVGSFIKHNLFDRLIVFFAPLLIGKDGIEGFNFILKTKNNNLGLKLVLKKYKILDDDIMAVYERE
ncbi:MAG: bifunctional diaminohydroxyphosphoribosylaminopyrimidine deaminase/5-amino-6-(5-phosphoribosylamino)uracil reductase RibD [Elusimicrobiota bacterium]